MDASALIALIAGEPEAPVLADIMEAAEQRLCSPLAVWETVAGLCHSHRFTVPAARSRVRLFLAATNTLFTNIGERDYEIATDAYARFGKGRHPAGLNMGDCFAYACAMSNGAALLFKGGDFEQTDVVIAG